MKKFVERPNLPHCAETVLLGEKYSFLEKNLRSCGLSPLFVPDNTYVDERLAGHADLSVFHAGGERVILAPVLRGSPFAHELEELGASCIFADVEQSAQYPHDAQLNACLAGERLICSRKITAEEIINSLTNRGVKPVCTRQGYAKCSVCVVDESSIITADSAICEQGRAAGLDVLMIEPGHIRLDGYEYGFIGGSSFKVSEKKLCFTGTLFAHPDEKRILSFLFERGIEPLFLTDEPIFDVGSVIPLSEKQ